MDSGSQGGLSLKSPQVMWVHIQVWGPLPEIIFPKSHKKQGLMVPLEHCENQTSSRRTDEEAEAVSTEASPGQTPFHHALRSPHAGETQRGVPISLLH